MDIPWYYDDERAASGLWSVVVGLPPSLPAPSASARCSSWPVARPGAALKFLTLSVLGVPTCFLVGYGLTRMPGVSRIV